MLKNHKQLKSKYKITIDNQHASSNRSNPMKMIRQNALKDNKHWKTTENLFCLIFENSY
jgi:predicted alpha/beta superfamily hydrolase